MRELPVISESRKREREHATRVRERWAAYHENLARVHTALADEHTRRARKLRGGPNPADRGNAA